MTSKAEPVLENSIPKIKEEPIFNENELKQEEDFALIPNEHVSTELNYNNENCKTEELEQFYLYNQFSDEVYEGVTNNEENNDYFNENDDLPLSCFYEFNINSLNSNENGSSSKDKVLNKKGDKNEKKSKNKTYTIKCKICPRVFPTKTVLRNHMKNHKKFQKFSCKMCNEVFMKKSTYETHMKVHKGEDPYKCDVCGIVLKSKGILKTHMGIHIHGKGFRKKKQINCEKEDILPLFKGNNLKRVKNDNPNSYELIMTEPKQFSDEVDEEVDDPIGDYFNENDESDEDNLPLSSFGKSNINSLNSSLKDNLVNSNKKSNKEGTSSKTKDKVLNKKGGKNITKSKSKKRNKSPSEVTKATPKSLAAESVKLKSNKIKQENDENYYPYNDGDREQEKKFFCNICNEDFKKNSTYEAHMKVHKSEDPYKCDVCGAVLKSQKSLTTHMGIHKDGIGSPKNKQINCDNDLKEVQNDNLNSYELVIAEPQQFSDEVYEEVVDPIGDENLINNDEENNDYFYENDRFVFDKSNIPSSYDNLIDSNKKGGKKEKKTKTKKINKSSSEVTKATQKSVAAEGVKLKSNKIKQENDENNYSYNDGNGEQEKKFSCDICNAAFKKNFTYQIHMKIHRGENPYKCDVCGTVLTSQAGLMSHMGIHIHGRGYRKRKRINCEVCGNSIEERRYQIHMRVHTGEKPVECKICFKKFTAEPNLRKHMILHRDPEFKCEICGKEIRLKKRFEEHMLIYHTSEQKFTCETCGMVFPTSDRLKKHIRNHTGEKPYQCKICQRKFNSNSSLSRHYNMHNGIKRHKCEVCGKAMGQKMQLIEHMALHSTERNFECEICGRRCATKKRLNEHMSCHPHGQPLECRLCKLVFSDKKEFKEHNLSQHPHIERIRAPRDDSSFKAFLCEICGKQIFTKFAAQIHIRSHTNEKPFQCTLCEKRFRSRDNLRIHMRIHTGYKPYKCDYCGKSFSQKAPLTIHIRSHTGERPYECHLCEKKYTQHNSLAAHLKTHLGEQPKL